MIMIQSLQCTIFPHASISEANLKKVLSLFERVNLFQPWFMEKLPSMARESPGMVQVTNPPERLKPARDFRTLLAEYRQWIRVNDERGFPALLAYAQDRFQEEPRVYEIRGMIRNMGKTVEEDEKARVLRWHLTLHLAEALEEEQESTKSLLRAVGVLDSPLKGALEDEDIPGLLSDVPGLEGETFFSEERLALVLDAWVSLYGEQIPGRGPLVTIKPQVMQFLKEIWEEFVFEGRATGLPVYNFLSPDLSTFDSDEFLKGRDAVLTGTGLRQAVADFCHDPGTGFPHPACPAGDAARATGALDWTFVYLPAHGEKRLPGKYQFMKCLSGKVIGLMQDAANHGR
jgi:hypothetical protein